MSRQLLLAVSLVACGGGGNASVDAHVDAHVEANVDACFEGFVDVVPGTQACFDCITSSCRSQLDAFEGACASLFSCACSNGAFDENAYERCGAEGLDNTEDCMDEDNAEARCQFTTCSASCGSGVMALSVTAPRD